MKQSSALAIWTVRPEAELIGIKLSQELGAKLYRPWLDRNGELENQSQKDKFAKAFKDHSAWVLVMASGIAVRLLTGLPEDKHSDPAVVVIDEACRYAIPLLGGHEGGANDLANRLANIFGAVPVVTTATEALKPLVLGIGCRKGVTLLQVESAVSEALLQIKGSDDEKTLSSVRELVTVDLKKHEPALLEFSAKHQLPLRWFSSADIAARAWTGQPSEWVRQAIGLDGVCEPCALMAGSRGRLLVPKTTLDGVAVAIVEDRTILRGEFRD
jgi:cobalt-precorrin 5A hydrolase